MLANNFVSVVGENYHFDPQFSLRIDNRNCVLQTCGYLGAVSSLETVSHNYQVLKYILTFLVLLIMH